MLLNETNSLYNTLIHTRQQVNLKQVYLAPVKVDKKVSNCCAVYKQFVNKGVENSDITKAWLYNKC
jgi:hypothetical protein